MLSHALGVPPEASRICGNNEFLNDTHHLVIRDALQLCSISDGVGFDKRGDGLLLSFKHICPESALTGYAAGTAQAIRGVLNGIWLVCVLGMLWRTSHVEKGIRSVRSYLRESVSRKAASPRQADNGYSR